MNTAQGGIASGGALIEHVKASALILPTIIAVLYTVFVALALGQTTTSFKYLPDLVWYLKLPFAFMASWVFAFMLLRVFLLFDDAERTDLAVVCAGGALGGFMLKFAVLLIDATNRPAIPLDHAMCAILGALCAGFTIFTISDTERRQKSRLFFLSVAAGLAFPSVVLSMMAFEPETVASAEQKVERASDLKDKLASGQRTDKTQNEIEKLDGEVASTVNDIANAPRLDLEEKVRQIEKLEPIVQSAFGGETTNESRSVAAIDQAKKVLGSQAKAQLPPETVGEGAAIDTPPTRRTGAPTQAATPIP